jgi:hypothetical protein
MKSCDRIVTSPFVRRRISDVKRARVLAQASTTLTSFEEAIDKTVCSVVIRFAEGAHFTLTCELQVVRVRARTSSLFMQYRWREITLATQLSTRENRRDRNRTTVTTH